MNRVVALVLIPILLIVGYLCVFTVQETEVALMLRFKKIIGTDFEPGLHFKSPIHNVMKFDKRIQTLDADAEPFLTSEKKNLIVDSFIKWRIIDASTFYKAVSGIPQKAKQRLREIIADGLRSEFGKRTIKEVVSGDRAEIMDIITADANKGVQKLLGIEIVDVRIKQIELPKEVRTSVYQRMEAERERDAKKLRSQGKAEAVRIRAGADRESIEMISKAERDAEKIRGEGDATAADIYARAYNQNPEFYALYRSLIAYKKTFSNRSDILLIQPDSDFFNYFKRLNGSTPTSLSAPPISAAPEQVIEKQGEIATKEGQQ